MNKRKSLRANSFPLLQNHPMSFSCFIMKSIRFDRMDSSVRRNLIPFFIYLRETFLFFIFYPVGLKISVCVVNKRKNKQPGGARANASRWWNVFLNCEWVQDILYNALKEVILIIAIFSKMYCTKKPTISPNSVQNCDVFHVWFRRVRQGWVSFFSHN